MANEIVNEFLCSEIKRRQKLNKLWGSECIFTPLSLRWGIKVVWDSKTTQAKSLEMARDLHYSRQQAVFCMGFAPRLGRKINLSCGPGYFTEVAETFLGSRDKSHHEQFISRFFDRKKDISTIIEEVFLETGWRLADDTIYNWGFLDDRLVIVDFGK